MFFWFRLVRVGVQGVEVRRKQAREAGGECRGKSSVQGVEVRRKGARENTGEREEVGGKR